MNRSSLLHIIERLEGFLGKLPDTIRRPVLHELTPLKELFLQQRPPRFVLTGSNRLPLQELAATLFNWRTEADSREVLMELFRWHAIDLGGRGTVSFLDARGADARTMEKIEEELKAYPPDMLLHLADDDSRSPGSGELENLGRFARRPPENHQPKIIGVVLSSGRRSSRDRDGDSSITATAPARARVQAALQDDAVIAPHLVQVVEVGESSSSASSFLSLLARTMPNEARVEMARIAQDRQVQGDIAQTLVKSTTAICAAIGAQPIPLADLPILTALQLVMVSGVMYISGRERSLRAATEFIGALGVNVGAGMILREGTRALLKFFPGWGNVVCGAVAGAGTYAMGRAAIVYFLEGMTLQQARRTYLSSRKKRNRPESRAAMQIEAAR
ncbi:MAG: YcjF family protein [Chthoniobacterales bacterium]